MVSWLQVILLVVGGIVIGVVGVGLYLWRLLRRMFDRW